MVAWFAGCSNGAFAIMGTRPWYTWFDTGMRLVLQKDKTKGRQHALDQETWAVVMKGLGLLQKSRNVPR